MNWLEVAQWTAIGYVAVSVIGYSVYLIVSSFQIVRK
jgi:preprotein translocase subunit Sss1